MNICQVTLSPLWWCNRLQIGAYRMEEMGTCNTVQVRMLQQDSQRWTVLAVLPYHSKQTPMTLTTTIPWLFCFKWSQKKTLTGLQLDIIFIISSFLSETSANGRKGKMKNHIVDLQRFTYQLNKSFKTSNDVHLATSSRSSIFRKNVRRQTCNNEWEILMWLSKSFSYFACALKPCQTVLITSTNIPVIITVHEFAWSALKLVLLNSHKTYCI